MAIPPETIEQIASANDIVEVIGTYFPLKRAGATFKALCPFHQEKTPSFTVSPSRQSFHCFGCGAGGSVFRFVMEYEHLDFPAAARKLAQRAGIAIIEERPSGNENGQHEARRMLLKLHAEAAEWFHENLMKRELGAPGREYLKTRGISAEVARSWKLGYAPESWDSFSKWAADHGYAQRDLIASGLVSMRESDSNQTSNIKHQTYDRFRGRLMFPIANDIGEVIAFSGRVLTAEASAAKYINSPETPLFRKGEVLFGLHKTKRALIEANSAIVCEGQLDLITLFQAGIQNVVAPQGTAFTERQAHTLKRLVAEVVLCFDADAAGQKAAERSLEALLQNDLIVRVAEMPPGEDPDSLVRKAGREAFEKLIAAAPDFFDYWTEKKTSTANLSSLGEKLRVARELAGAVAHVRDPLMRGEVINRIAARLAIRAADLDKAVRASYSALGRDGAGTRSAQVEGSTAVTPAPPHDLAMLCLLALRDENARNFLLAQNWRKTLPGLPGAELLAKILTANFRPDDPASLSAFESTLESGDEALVSGWLLQRLPEEPATVAREWWNGLRQAGLRRELDAAESKLRRPSLTAGEIMQLQKQVLDLREQLHDFDRFSPARPRET
ncbi:MAG: DNA primase [Verrucomicrobia bacterium]|nr:DNA primase [Verrucomicrobiota bacterium]